MKVELKQQLISHMIDFGLHMIGRGLVNATFAETPYPYTHSMAVIHIAHGAELLFKARIAEEHPLLIFSKYPSEYNSINNEDEVSQLIQEVQTIQFSELPKRLQITTGYKIANLKLFEEYGRLRNQIMHFAIPPNKDISSISFEFSFTIIEHAINEWWNDTIFNYGSIYDDCFLQYVFEQITICNIKFDLSYIKWLKENHNISLEG